MSVPASLAGVPAPPGRGGAWPTAALLLIVGAATSVAVVVGQGNAAIAALPVVLAAMIYALWRAPLRWSASALCTLLLAMPLSNDSEGKLRTPLSVVGDLLKENVDTLVPASRLKVNGMELLLLFLLLVAIARRAAGSTIDTRGRAQTPRPLRNLALVFIGSVALAAANGLAHGGSTGTVIWHARPLLHDVALFFLFQAAFRGPRDVALIGRIIVLSACVKALLGFYFLYVIAPHTVRHLSYITNHWDSILFSMACLVLFTSWLERPDRKRLAWLLVLSPVLLWAIRCNSRRIAWVELAFGLVAILLVGSRTPAKRALLRFAVVMTPIVLLYGVAGWSSTARVFAPIKMVRTMTDAKADRSAWDRDVEDWNIMTSMWQRPLLGRGFGFEYTEFIKGDDLTSVFPMYRSVPHNGVLGLLLFAGALAFTGVWTFFAAGIFFAARAYPFARDAETRAAALSCMAGVLVFWVQAWGDLGVGSTQGKVVSALAVAMAGKLAVATGAWPTRAPGRRAAGAAAIAPQVPLGSRASAERAP